MGYSITSRKVSYTVSYVLSVIATVFFLLPAISSNNKHFITPFTCNFVIVIIYWFITLLAQFLFIAKSFFNEASSTQSQINIINIIGSHFTVSNLLHFFWCYFFRKKFFLLSECIIVANLLNLLLLYFHHKTTSIGNIVDWLTLHLPLVGFPLSWTIFTLFWNGACLFHSHNKSLLARILANIFIWDFFFIPLVFAIFHSDWSIALSTSLLLLGVGLNQLFTKVFALQWIFAFVIAALDLVIAVSTIISSSLGNGQKLGSNQPTLPDHISNGEHDPLVV